MLVKLEKIDRVTVIAVGKISFGTRKLSLFGDEYFCTNFLTKWEFAKEDKIAVLLFVIKLLIFTKKLQFLECKVSGMLKVEFLL